jgi:hypothetical protein
MKVITATIVDATHLEVSQPAPPGTTIQIAVPAEGEDDRAWRDAARQHFLDGIVKLTVSTANQRG